MNISCGIVGLPNVGKSTLFNALLSRQVADAANYPFCTIEPNTGIVEVPDERLRVLAELSHSQKIIPSVIKFVDIAGLVKGASRGEGLGNKFLAHIREVDIIIHVVRAFSDDRIARSGSTNPQKDYDIVTTELCLADYQTIEKQKEPKGKVDKAEQLRWQTILKLKKALAAGIPARRISLNKAEQQAVKDLNLITRKKEIVVLNIDEKNLTQSTKIKASFQQWNPIIISAKVEAELIELTAEERKEYLNALNVQSSGLEKLIKKAHKTLGLIDFLTTGEKETRAWTIKKGAKAPEAAGVIHSDFQKGFIRAAVVSYQDFVKYGGWKELKEAGRIRFEGKDYEVQDGDVIEFYHN